LPKKEWVEELGYGVRYIDQDQTISIMNEPTDINKFEKTIWQIHFRLSIGNEKTYVRQLLNKPNAEKTSKDGQQEIWRYDFEAIPNYQYNGVDRIDIDGLGQGRLRGQLLISWSTEGLLDKVEFWYISSPSSPDRKTYSYQLNPDGTSIERMYE